MYLPIMKNLGIAISATRGSQLLGNPFPVTLVPGTRMPGLPHSLFNLLPLIFSFQIVVLFSYSIYDAVYYRLFCTLFARWIQFNEAVLFDYGF